MGLLTIKRATAASVPTPATGKCTFFFDDADGRLKFKDDTGAIISVAGGTPSDFYYQSTPPSEPLVPGDRWVDTTDNTQYTWIDDGSSTQWVDLNA